jgi:hypothetical protein
LNLALHLGIATSLADTFEGVVDLAVEVKAVATATAMEDGLLFDIAS